MKKFFNNNKLILGISLILVAIFIFGNIYSSAVINHRAEELADDQEKYNEAVEVVSIEYNFDTETLGDNVYLVEFTFEDSTYKTYVNETFCYVEMVEGEELELMVMSALKHNLEKGLLIQNTAYIVSYDVTTKIVVIETEGFNGIISVEMTINDTFDGITSYTVTSLENYDNDYNSGYEGGATPEVENTMLDQYMTGVNDLDTISGASVGTGEAIQELVTLLNLFIDSLEGGN